MKTLITIGGKARSVERYTLDMGYLDQKELGWCEHRRGKNWIASVAHHPGEPGGLHRHFWKSGSGSYRLMPADTIAGQYLEVAYDYVGSRGKQYRDRLFFRVLQVSEDSLVLREANRPGRMPPDWETEAIAAEVDKPGRIEMEAPPTDATQTSEATENRE